MEKKTLNLIGMLKAAPENERGEIMRKTIDRLICEILCQDEEATNDYNTIFNARGMDSITAVTLKEKISQALAGEVVVETSDIFDYPTVNKLSAYLLSELKI